MGEGRGRRARPGLSGSTTYLLPPVRPATAPAALA